MASKLKKILLFIIFLFSFTLSNYAQQATFQKAFGGSGGEYLYDIHKTFDGGYILGGTTTSLPASPNVSSYIVKTNYQGDTLWTASFTGIGGSCDQQYINDIYQLNDSGYISVGGKTVCGDINAGGDIVRLDKNGNVLWSKYCSASEDPYPVIQSADGSFIVGGYLTGIGAGAKDACLMKLDANGDTLWSRTYGGVSGDEWFYHILQSPDGGYLAAGYSTSFGQGGEDVYLVKTDTNGNLQWSKTYGTAANNESAFGHCVQSTADGGYILTGESGTGTQSAQGIFLMKIDSSGNMNWAKYYNGIYGHVVKQTPDKGYAIAGNSSAGVELIKTDSSGNVLWSMAYGGNQGFFLALANDGGYVLGGQTVSFGAGFKDGFMVKTDAAGNSGCATTNPGVVATVAPFISANAATQVFQGATTVAYPLLYQRGTTITTLCSAAAINPNNNTDSICNGNNASIVCEKIAAGNTFQWQADTGTGYQNIINDIVYSNANTDTLQLTLPSSSYANYNYRCIITNIGITDTSLIQQLHFVNTWTGNIDTTWENPNNWNCTSIPDINTDVIINSTVLNFPTVSSNANCKSLTLKPGTFINIKVGYGLNISGKK